MPRNFLEADLEALGPIYADDERAIASLARKYRVSPQAMAIRLSTLNLVWMWSSAAGARLRNSPPEYPPDRPRRSVHPAGSAAFGRS